MKVANDSTDRPNEAVTDSTSNHTSNNHISEANSASMPTNMDGTITASEMKQHFGKYLDAAQRAPVTIKKNGRPTAVLVSFEDYQKNIAVDNVDLDYWSNEFERLQTEHLLPTGSSAGAHDALFNASPAALGAAHQAGFTKRGY